MILTTQFRKLLQRLLVIICLLIGAGSHLSISFAQGLTADEAAQQVQSTTGGVVVGISRSADPDPPGFWVRVLHPDGRVQDIFVPG